MARKPHLFFGCQAPEQSRWGLLSLLVVCLLAVGCRREEVRVYRTAKEHRDHDHGHQHQHGTEARPTLKWQTPAGWEEQAPSQFRVASFKITGQGDKQADVSIIPLPGGAGGELGNVNRWRGQVGLAPITEEELKKIAEPTGLSPATALYDLGGETIRILAAMQVRDGTTWFYKMTGDTVLVAEQKPRFVEFLKSVQFVAATPAVPPAASAAKAHWPVPAGWTEADAGQFLVAKFLISGEDKTQASLNISSSVGDGGGLTANVNRWRQQLGLPEWTADELTAGTKFLETTAGRGMLVEMTGASAALVAVIVPHGGQTWFFKLMGDTKVVASQRAAFMKFMQEARF